MNLVPGDRIYVVADDVMQRELPHGWYEVSSIREDGLPLVYSTSRRRHIPVFHDEIGEVDRDEEITR